MEPKQKDQYEKQIELSKRLQSIANHPEWVTILELIDQERKFHANKAKSVEFRHDPTQYANIVRALDNADAIQAVLDKFTTIARLGREAQEKIDAADGLNQPPA